MDLILDMIRRGINVKSFFDYDGEKIPIRAVASSEIDDARLKSLGKCDNKLAALIIKIRMGELNKTVPLDQIPVEMYLNYVKYIFEFDYWVVYHAMKDFRDSSFSIDDVRKMRHVHRIAQDAINMSTCSDIFLDEIIYSEEGKEIAKIAYTFKIPLVSEQWKLTPLQHKFLEKTGPNAPIAKVADMDKFKEILPIIGDRIRHG